jgi:hypothetical protein
LLRRAGRPGRPRRAIWCLALALLMPGEPARAQDDPEPSLAERTLSLPDPEQPTEQAPAGAPRVFLDCDRCDMPYIRQEVVFVNHIRQPDAAEVHVIITHQPTGSGGRRYTLDFIGRFDLAGVNNTLTFNSLQSNSAAQERDGLLDVLKLGLVPYAARTGLASALQVSFKEGVPRPPQVMLDRWNNWTFEVYAGGNTNIEQAQTAVNARYGLYANRVTDNWKVRMRPYFNHNMRRIRPEGQPEIRTDLVRHGFESHVIKSLGNHFGAGMFGDYLTSTVDNIASSVVIAPAVEYSLFPYAEATRREATLTYRIGYEVVDFIEETLYGRTEDTLLRHSLEAGLRLRQRWGSTSSTITGARYLEEGNFFSLTVSGTASLQLGRGVALNVGGVYQRINDQIALPRRNVSLEDILLAQRRLATSYRTSMNLSVSYTFGSIFSNIVNPRF